LVYGFNLTTTMNRCRSCPNSQARIHKYFPWIRRFIRRHAGARVAFVRDQVRSLNGETIHALLWRSLQLQPPTRAGHLNTSSLPNQITNQTADQQWKLGAMRKSTSLGPFRQYMCNDVLVVWQHRILVHSWVTVCQCPIHLATDGGMKCRPSCSVSTYMIDITPKSSTTNSQHE
jgi:hypothetical protein